jgi:hypothetical protein
VVGFTHEKVLPPTGRILARAVTSFLSIAQAGLSGQEIPTIHTGGAYKVDIGMDLFHALDEFGFARPTSV